MCRRCDITAYKNVDCIWCVIWTKDKQQQQQQQLQSHHTILRALHTITHTQSLQTIRELHGTKRHPKKPEKRMIIKRKACIIINQIMYLLSECVREWACAYVRERVNECPLCFYTWTECWKQGFFGFLLHISLFALHAMNRRIQSETNAECDVEWLRGFCVLWKYIELTKHSVADTQQFWTFQMIFHCILRSKNKWRTLRVKAPLRSLILI